MLWEQNPTPEKSQAFSTVVANDPDVLAYSSAGPYAPSALVKFDPATGRQTTVHSYPAASHDGARAGYLPLPLPFLERGTLYLSAGDVTELPSMETDKREKALLALPADWRSHSPCHSGYHGGRGCSPSRPPVPAGHPQAHTMWVRALFPSSRAR
ncbi:hypothetical protein [Streptomyces eurocidicus]|uniref:Uncharacterized protein n=1 Tax=Streptomyces eurocidicus TaxID=66423 RepID=A0A7W8F4U0_STREU|nr:hypothetical protein [Streptomyces eurocidicus]MBB5123228.1 hypothetical protein [Streptomyces eurocidicus]MBF6056208.1 hypothetical protein [Streptomyces eurocidicus]